MSYYPTLTELKQSRYTIDSFGGINRGLRGGENEFKNLIGATTAYYPALSSRNKVSVGSTVANPQGMIAKDALAYVNGADLIYNGYTISMSLSTDPKMCPKQLVSMGAYLVIFPDKKYINTEKFDSGSSTFTDYGSLDASFTTTSGDTVEFSMCALDGSAINTTNITISDTAPSEPTDLQYWIDSSQTAHILKQYSSSSGMWVQIPTVYTKIYYEGIGKPFGQYDGIKISGCTATGTTKLNGANHVYAVSDNYIVVIGLIDQAVSQTSPVTVSRSAPTMNFVVEAENRLWGCYYGMVNGAVVNEIYASKLGDPKNWNSFRSISTDSWVAGVGSDGVFTGAITYGSGGQQYPLFFKENCVHKVYPSSTGAHQIVTQTCRGVQNGSSRSLAIVDEVLYYKSPIDFCAYDGASPASISDKLGTTRYTGVSCGAYKDKLYASVLDCSDNVRKLLVYDTAHGLWVCDSTNVDVDFFAQWDGKLFYINGNTINIVGDSSNFESSTGEFLAETTDIGYEYPDNKYVTRINIRMGLPAGVSLIVSLKYDGGDYKEAANITGSSGTVSSFTLPITPVRCDHFSIRLYCSSVTEQIQLYSITKILEQGSDVV